MTLNLTWRPFTPDDISAVTGLDTVVKRADGFEPVSNIVGDTMKAKDTLSGWTQDNQLVALAWIKQVNSESVMLGGRVHPDYRRQGFGGHLLDWSESKACENNTLKTLVIRSEALTVDADKLYSQRGFTQDFAENMLVYDLSQPVNDLPLSDGLRLASWSAETSPVFFRVYSGAFKERPGFANPDEAEWVEEYEEDEEFDRTLSVVALRGDEPVSFITCGTLGGLGWVSQIGTTTAARGGKLGQVLMSHALRGFQANGLSEAGLHVNVNNPKATHVFETFGFKKRLQRAKYVKSIR